MKIVIIFHIFSSFFSTIHSVFVHTNRWFFLLFSIFYHTKSVYGMPTVLGVFTHTPNPRERYPVIRPKIKNVFSQIIFPLGIFYGIKVFFIFSYIHTWPDTHSHIVIRLSSHVENIMIRLEWKNGKMKMMMKK